MKDITFEIVRQSTIGRSPKEIATSLNMDAHAVRMALSRQRKKAKGASCYFTGEPAVAPVYFESRIVYVSARLLKLFQAGLDSEDCAAILRKSETYRPIRFELLQQAAAQ